MKTGKKLLSLLLSLLLALGAVSVGFVSASAEVTLSGSGTAEDPYRIEKYEELKAFASIVNGGNSSACAVLMNDINASASNTDTWTPIGNLNNKYTGVFDGRGYVIKWLSYNSSADYAGLFGYVKGVKENGITVGGIVKNVVLEGGSITGGYNVGGVAGRIESGTVTDCRNTGKVSGTNKVGGIAGYNEKGTVTDCSNTGDVSGNYIAGGVAGSNSDYCIISNCSNSGNVTATENSSIAGGVVGDTSNQCSVTNCFNTGDVSGIQFVGGVAGESSRNSSVTNCYNTGNVSGSTFVGGVAGDNASNSTIINCYNTGTVTATRTSGSKPGGVVGNNTSSSKIKNCYNTGKVTVTGTAPNVIIGGVAGQNYNSTVEYCYYDSDSVTGVSAIGDETEATSSHVEGLSTADMTGVSALDKMVFYYENGEESPWIVRENDTFGSYYPHLSGFDYDNTGALADWPARKLNDGAADDPYEISTYTQLKDFAYIVNNWNTSACAILINDIDASSSASANDWTPIGTGERIDSINMEYLSYTGTFDGGGHVITGLTFNDPSADHAGLFGRMGSITDSGVTIKGSVKNVGLEGGSITGQNFVGGIAGYNEKGTVAGCYNTGYVTSTGDSAYAGGVVGLNHSETFSDCYNTGTVRTTGLHSSAGGVVGFNYGVTVTNCFNTGDVSASDHAGGVVGVNSGSTMQSCYNTGAVSGNAAAGGVAGYNTGTVKNCYNTGDVTGSATETDVISYTGGVAGVNYINSSISNCCNTGDISSYYYAGGVAGNNHGTITNCYNTGDVSGSYSAGGVAGDNYRGTATYCYYDRMTAAIPGASEDNNWKAVGNSTIDTVTGLTTAEMTGADALSDSNMKFVYSTPEENTWLTKADGAEDGGEYYWFYPHLKGFNLNSDSTQMSADEIEAADWPAKTEVSVTWEERAQYIYNGKPQMPAVTSVIIGDASVPAGEDATYFKYTYSGENNKWEWAESSGSLTNPGKYKMEIRSGEDTVTKYFTILEAVTDYTVSYYKKVDSPWSTDPVDPVDAGYYKAVITFLKEKVTGEEVTYVSDESHAPIEKEFKISPKAVTITAKSDSKVYDGSALTESGFTASALETGDTHTFTVEMTENSTIVNKGIAENVIATVDGVAVTPGSAVKVGNYSVTAVNGTLEITPADVTVAITGNSSVAGYDGSVQSVNGYTATASDALYDVENDIDFSGTALATLTEPGTVSMGLDAGQFSNNNTNFNVTFTVVQDGNLTVNPVVTFANEDGTPLQSDAVDLGSTPEYKGEKPVKADDEWYSYEFDKWTPDITQANDNATYTAAFTATPLEFTATFVDENGDTVDEIPYTVETASITEPAVPESEGRTGAWESYTLSSGGITVKPVYEANEYTATLIADGKEIKKIPFTYGQKSIDLPDVPEKTGYTGEWESYSLGASDITINAVYTPVKYTATFIADGKTVAEVPFTVETESITEPAVPEKEGYTGEWSDYTLAASDIEINAVYTEIPAEPATPDEPATETEPENDNLCPLDGTDHGTSFMGKIIKFFHSILWSLFRLVGLDLNIRITWAD